MNSGCAVALFALCGGVIGWLWFDSFIAGVICGLILFLVACAVTDR